MPKNARIPQVDRSNKRLLALRGLLAELADGRCPGENDYEARSNAAMSVMADVLWLDEQLRLEADCSTDAVIEVDGEPYRRLNQASSRVYHGTWGAHDVREPLYRRVGVRNGPTIKPLEGRIGIVGRSLLPDLARKAGGLMASMTSREVELSLERLGFRPPSRAVLEEHVIDLFGEMTTRARSLEEHCRNKEELDFELGVISCGLDRFATRMDERLPDGEQRDEKIRRRRPADQYQRTPPEPHEVKWRMAWAGNVTLYDKAGQPRWTFRYGTSADDDVGKLIARMVDEIVRLIEQTEGVTVCCIQDGAADLEPLRRELDERLPKSTARCDLVDFHHAISYLDATVSVNADDDHCDMRGWYRVKLLTDERGASDIVTHLRRRRDHLDVMADHAELAAVDAALSYFEKRRPRMGYAAARAANQPVGSGATESTCGLFQLRVKHPGSHWSSTGLRAVLTARALELSGRWERAFDAYKETLRTEVRAAA